MNKVFSRYLGAAMVLLMAMVFLSIGMAGSTEAADPVINVNSNTTLDDLIDENLWAGSGTEADPYIIENLDIDATGVDYSIQISNTDRYLVIKDCILCGSMNYGIKFYNVHNVVLENNTCDLTSYGIYLETCSNIVVDGNDCRDNVYGVYLDGSNDITIQYNNCSENTQAGLYLTFSYTNTVSNNTCNDNGQDNLQGGIVIDSSNENVVYNNDCAGNYFGIRLYHSPVDNVLRENILLFNLYGIYIETGSTGNLMDGNTISSLNSGIFIDASVGNVINNTIISGCSYGIYLSSSDHTVVTNNTISSCLTGLYTYYSDYLVVFENDIIGNTNNGMEFSNSIGSVVANNTCSQNGQHGVRMYGSDDNTVINSECLDNSGNGIYLGESDNNRLVNNTCASPSLFYGSANAGIYLEWSNSNVISNNTCSNNGDGLILESSYYNTVSGNNLSYNNNYMGTHRNIKVDSSDNNMINNTCLGADYGMSISGGSDIRIEGNTFSYNTGAGIEAYNFEHERFVIANNTCNGNGYGIHFSWVYDSTITNNTCEDNGKAGMYLEYRCHSNLVTNNTLSNNGYQLVDDGYGMAFAGHGLAINGAGDNNCHDNIIANNTIEGSRLHGINITSSTGNRLFGNVLIGNHGSTSEYDPAHMQAYDDGADFWNDTEYGNLWGDWTSPDANGDGIVDEAYVIEGGTDKDLLPLAASLAITSPSDGFTTGAASVDLQGSAVSYFGVDQVTWHNAATGGSGVCSGTESWTATVPLASGANLITVTMTDLHGSEVNDSITVVLDAISPSLDISYPAEGAFVGSSVTVSWTSDDADSGVAHYNVSLDGGEWYTTTEKYYPFTGLSGGAHTVVVSAFDNVGNHVERMVNFTVDLTAPTVAIISPADGSLYTTGSITVTWTGSDAGSGISHYEVSWEGGTPVSLSSSAQSHTFTDLSDGSHVLTVTVYDLVGLSSSDTVTVNVDTQAPSLTITSPADGSYSATGSVTVTWIGSDAGSGIAYYNVSIDGEAFIQLASNATQYTFTELTDDVHTVNVTAVDLVGNEAWEDAEFTVDTIGPSLSMTSPEEGALLNETAVSVQWAANDANPIIVRIRFDDGTWLVVTGNEHIRSLADGAHVVHINVTDLAGNYNETSNQFTVDATAPTATGSPTGQWVTVDADIVVQFSETMSMTSVSVVVEGVILSDPDWDGSTVTFWHPVDLDYAHEYQVNVTGKDLAGNDMELNWTFRTLPLTSFVGVVVDPEGEPMSGVTVTLNNGTMSESQTTSTDGTFEFGLAGNVSGVFNISAVKEGYLPLTVENITVDTGGTYDLGTTPMTAMEGPPDDNGWVLYVVIIVVLVAVVAIVLYLKKKK